MKIAAGAFVVLGIGWALIGLGVGPYEGDTIQVIVGAALAWIGWTLWVRVKERR